MYLTDKIANAVITRLAFIEGVASTLAGPQRIDIGGEAHWCRMTLEKERDGTLYNPSDEPPMSPSGTTFDPAVEEPF